MITSFFPQDFCLISAMLQGHVLAESSLSHYTLRKSGVKTPNLTTMKTLYSRICTVLLAKYCFRFKMPPERNMHGFPTTAGLLLAWGMQVKHSGLCAAVHVALPAVIPCHSIHTSSLADTDF